MGNFDEQNWGISVSAVNGAIGVRAVRKPKFPGRRVRAVAALVRTLRPWRFRSCMHGFALCAAGNLPRRQRGLELVQMRPIEEPRGFNRAPRFYTYLYSILRRSRVEVFISAREVDEALVRGPDERAAWFGRFGQVWSVNKQVDVVEKRQGIFRLQRFVRVAREADDPQPGTLCEAREFGTFGGLVERLPAQKSQAFVARFGGLSYDVYRIN